MKMYKFKMLCMMLLCVSFIVGFDFSNDENAEDEEVKVYSLLEKQFHMPYIDILEEKGIELQCESEREDAIASVPEALENTGVYLEKVDSWFSGSYYEITNYKTGYIYYGELKDNKPHGFGVILMLDGTEYFYIGEFSKGQFEGYGAMFDQSNLGEPYLVYDSDRDEYIAQENEATEIALYVSNHVTYDGEWKDGEKYGEGNTYLDIIELESSSGELKAVDESYWASCFYPETIYTGEYKKDLYDGDIKLYFQDYLIYDGEMDAGLFDGKGTLYNLNSGIIYTGKWDNGLYDKTGTLYYSNGNIQYDGKWNDGLYNGKGTLYDENGNIIYSGKWKNGDYKS